MLTQAGGLLYTEDGPFTSDTVTNTYINRLRTTLSLQQPTGAWTNRFGWDAAKRLTNVTSQAGSFTNLYFLWGWRCLGLLLDLNQASVASQ